MVRDGVLSATVARLTVQAEGDAAVATLHRAAEVSKRGKATAGAIRKAREPARSTAGWSRRCTRNRRPWCRTI